MKGCTNESVAGGLESCGGWQDQNCSEAAHCFIYLPCERLRKTLHEWIRSRIRKS